VPLWLLSCPGGDPGAYSGKYEWVCRNAPRLKGRLILADAKEAVAGPGKLLIDDRDENVDRWVWPGGGVASLVPRAWNRSHRYRHVAAEQVDFVLRVNLERR